MFFWFAKYVMWLGTHLTYRFKIVGRENIPKEGAFILCGNHISAMDPIVITVGTGRRLYFMGKKELFNRKFFDFFLRRLGAFPVDRGAADMKAFKHTLEILNGGKGLLLFAQGTRSQEFKDSKGGAALFALKTGSPIVPVGITATYKLFTLVTVKIGKPISMDEYKEKRIKSALLDEVMENVTEQIRGLME